MRIEPFLRGLVYYDFSGAKQLSTSTNIFGGWEGWFQVELARYLFSKLAADHIVIVREVSYPGSRFRCDFCFGYGEEMRDITYVELKCQLPGTPDPVANALLRFQADIDKQRVFLPTTVGFCLLATRGPWEERHIDTLRYINTSCSSAFALVATDGGNIVGNCGDLIASGQLREDHFFLIGISP
jgi:hypothetical protein